MTFDAREALAEAEADGFPPFEFIGLDGNKYQLPNPMGLTEGQLTAVKQWDEETARELLGDEAWEALQDLPLHVSLKLGEAWMELLDDSGKSQLPSRAIRRSAKRSKPTSRSGG